MPKLAPTPASLPFIKGIMMGQSGTGKSSAIIALAIDNLLASTPGYELRVLDFDGKFEEMGRSVLANFLTTKKITQTQHDEALGRMDVLICREKTKVLKPAKIGAAGIIGAHSATAWRNGLKQIQEWESTFTDRTILVIDSLTYAVRAIVNQTQSLNNQLNNPLTFHDYTAPQKLVEDLMVMCADLPTHVLVTGHQDPYEVRNPTPRKDDKGNIIEEVVDVLVLPMSVGQAGRPRLPAQFNHMLGVTTSQVGTRVERQIYTAPVKGILCKTPFIGRAKDKYPIATGLVEYFRLRSPT